MPSENRPKASIHHCRSNLDTCVPNVDCKLKWLWGDAVWIFELMILIVSVVTGPFRVCIRLFSLWLDFGYWMWATTQVHGSLKWLCNLTYAISARALSCSYRRFSTPRTAGNLSTIFGCIVICRLQEMHSFQCGWHLEMLLVMPQAVCHCNLVMLCENDILL